MNGAGRSCVVAGVAFVGASVIGVTPVAPPVPDIKVASPAVQLTARPFDAYVELFENTAANLAGTPILDAVIANAELVGEALASGDLGETFDEVVGVAVRAQDALAFLAEASVILPGQAIFVLVATTANEAGMISQDLSDALTAQDWLDVAYLVAEIPARLANAVLNGSGVTGGLLDGLRYLREDIGDLLAPDVVQPLREAFAETLAPNQELRSATSTADPERAALVTVDIAQNADLPEVVTPAEDNDPLGTVPADLPTEAPDATTVRPDEGPDEDGATGGAETTGDAAVVRDSLKAEPGKTGMKRNPDRPTPLKGLRKDVRNGLRDADVGLADKSQSSSSSTGPEESSDSQNSGSSSDAA